jgi:CMP-2-keto-3-deoxyoctulosonic acid synthetase
MRTGSARLTNKILRELHCNPLSVATRATIQSSSKLIVLFCVSTRLCSHVPDTGFLLSMCLLFADTRLSVLAMVPTRTLCR